MRTEEMASSDLEDLCFHINTKISTIKKILHLRSIGKSNQEEVLVGTNGGYTGGVGWEGRLG